MLEFFLCGSMVSVSWALVAQAGWLIAVVLVILNMNYVSKDDV